MEIMELTSEDWFKIKVYWFVIFQILFDIGILIYILV